VCCSHVPSQYTVTMEHMEDVREYMYIYTLLHTHCIRDISMYINGLHCVYIIIGNLK